MIIIGIDPGLGGAVGAINTKGEYIAVVDMPIMAKGKATGRVKNCVNPAELKRALEMILEEPDASDGVISCLEQVNSRPEQGVAGMFSLGDSYGCARSVLACMGIRMLSVVPSVWKRFYQISADKEVARAIAIQMWPNCADLGRKKDVDRAEALLIAKFALEKLRGEF